MYETVRRKQAGLCCPSFSFPVMDVTTVHVCLRDVLQVSCSNHTSPDFMVIRSKEAPDKPIIDRGVPSAERRAALKSADLNKIQKLDVFNM